MRRVYFTDDQFDTLYKFVSANRHRNEDLSEVAAVLDEANKWVVLQED